MTHDVFISHSSADKDLAGLVCKVLESVQVRCWIAPRDIIAGMPYAEALIQAIDSSRVMVLIFSEASNKSPQVLREVNRSVSKDIPIVPFRIEDVTPSDSMEYFIGLTHWLDAFRPPFEEHLKKLVEAVMMRLGEATERPTVSAAIVAVDDKLRAMQAASPITHDHISTVIGTAISFGAPIYNSGSHDDCARIYLHATRGLLDALNSTPNRLVADSSNDSRAATRDELNAALAPFGSLTPDTIPAEAANPLAWALRHAFDHIRLMPVVSQGMRDVSDMLRRIRERGGPLRFAELCDILLLAVKHGNVLFDGGDFRGIVELHVRIARDLVASIPQLPVANGDAERRQLIAACKLLEPFVTGNEQARGPEAEGLAWDVYKAFVRILKPGAE